MKSKRERPIIEYPVAFHDVVGSLRLPKYLTYREATRVAQMVLEIATEATP